MMKIEVTYDPSDFLRATTFMHRRRMVVFISVLIVGWIMVLCLAFNPEDWGWWMVVTIPFAVIVVLLLVRLLQNVEVRKQLKQTPTAQGRQTYLFEEDRITMTGGLYDLDLKWEAITKAVESKHDFFLYPSGNVAYLLPKRAFVSDGEQEQLREMLHRKLGNKARLR